MPVLFLLGSKETLLAEDISMISWSFSSLNYSEIPAFEMGADVFKNCPFLFPKQSQPRLFGFHFESLPTAVSLLHPHPLTLHD